jgi:hypothetical protein
MSRLYRVVQIWAGDSSVTNRKVHVGYKLTTEQTCKNIIKDLKKPIHICLMVLNV